VKGVSVLFEHPLPSLGPLPHLVLHFRGKYIDRILVFTNFPTAANSVPSMRMMPWFTDCPTVARLMNATANPAHMGFSQSICRAMP